MTEFRIALVLGLFALALAVMWFASPRTRKLAIFAVIVVLAGAALFGLMALIRAVWFPLPPL